MSEEMFVCCLHCFKV